MKFNLKLLLGTAALSILTFGTITEAEANFIGRVYDKLEPWEFRGSYGRKQVRETRYHKHRLLEITSEFDDPIKITNIKVNRGNCGIMFFPQWSMPLKWGQSQSWRIDENCRVREVTIETDRGSQTLKWN